MATPVGPSGPEPGKPPHLPAPPDNPPVNAVVSDPPQASVLLTVKGIALGKGKLSTNSILGAAVTAFAVYQVPMVHDAVAKYAVNHPHVASVIAFFTFASAVIHNPQVRQILKLKPEE